MKKLLIWGFISLFVLTSCTNETKNEDDTVKQRLAEQEALAKASREELETALNERDELLSLINEINENISEIQSVESIVTMKGVGEGNEKTTITNNLSAIKSTLAERRKKLSELEGQLKKSKLSNTKLLETIDGLKQQIDQQSQTIENLMASLETAKNRIAELDDEVETLNTTVSTVSKERDQAQNEALNQANLANECYYAIGTKKELKQHNIVESGFLRKTKIMPEDFDKGYFIKADKRTLTSIPLHAKKAKVVSSAQPTNSYEIIDQGGQKILKITNPSEFWSVSNYVVIQID